MTTKTVVPPATVDLAATGADAFRAAAGGVGGLVDFVNAAPGRYVRLVNDTGGSQAFGFRGTAVLTLPAGGAFVGRVGYDPLTDARNPLAASPRRLQVDMQPFAVEVSDEQLAALLCVQAKHCPRGRRLWPSPLAVTFGCSERTRPLSVHGRRAGWPPSPPRAGADGAPPPPSSR